MNFVKLTLENGGTVSAVQVSSAATSTAPGAVASTTI